MSSLACVAMFSADGFNLSVKSVIELATRLLPPVAMICLVEPRWPVGELREFGNSLFFYSSLALVSCAIMISWSRSTDCY